MNPDKATLSEPEKLIFSSIWKTHFRGQLGQLGLSKDERDWFVLLAYFTGLISTFDWIVGILMHPDPHHDAQTLASLNKKAEDYLVSLAKASRPLLRRLTNKHEELLEVIQESQKGVRPLDVGMIREQIKEDVEPFLERFLECNDVLRRARRAMEKSGRTNTTGFVEINVGRQ